MSSETYVPNPNRRKILLLTQDFEVWGAQRQIVELAKGLDPTLYSVRLGTLELGGPLVSEIAALGIPVESFPRRWRWDLSPISRLAGYLRRESIDIIHSFLFLPNFYARLAGRLARTPAVVSSLRSTGIEGWPRYALDIATCVMCDALIANSTAGRDHYTRRGGLRNRIVVVRNGLAAPNGASATGPTVARQVADLERFERLIGMVGALEPRKDQALLVRAMREVVNRKPNVGLVLAGDGCQRARLERLTRSLGLESHVIFLGLLHEPHRLYPLLDVYCQASFSGEGISNSILEAMVHSLPVVATDVGGNREVVVHGDTGYIVPRGDATALADALSSLLSDPVQRAHMGRRGTERVRTVFSLETMVTATERVYDRVLATRQRVDRRHAGSQV